MGLQITNPDLVIFIMFITGIITFVIIVIVLDSLGIKNLTLEKAHKLAKRSRENGPAFAGLVILDIIDWTIWRPQLEEKVTTLALHYITIGVNCFFSLFIFARFVATWLAKKRIEELELETLNDPTNQI